MLQNKAQSIKAIQSIAHVLSDLNEQVVFVGGAVIGLYVDDPGAPEVRPTKDIDIALEITSVLKLEEIRQKLAERGIHFARDEKVICRFIYQNIFLDVMSTKEIGWAPANIWFKDGFDRAEEHIIDDVKIRIMPLSYYLAAKVTAFKNRGGDPRTSHDFEDIVYILDNRTTLVNDIIKSEDRVKNFLIAEFKTVLNNAILQEAILAHLEPVVQTQRYDMLKQKLKDIVVR